MQVLTGRYESATYRFLDGPDGKVPRPTAIEVVEEDGALYTVTARGTRRELVPTGDGHFRRRNQPQATIAITRDRSGVLVLQGDIGNYRRVESRE